MVIVQDEPMMSLFNGTPRARSDRQRRQPEVAAAVPAMRTGRQQRPKRKARQKPKKALQRCRTHASLPTKSRCSPSQWALEHVFIAPVSKRPTLAAMAAVMFLCFSTALHGQSLSDLPGAAAAGEAEITDAERIDILDLDEEADRAIASGLGRVFAQIDGLRDVEISVQAGVVTLTGTVTTQSDRAKAEAIAARIAGVVAVENAIDRNYEVDSTLSPAVQSWADDVQGLMRGLPLFGRGAAGRAGHIRAGISARCATQAVAVGAAERLPCRTGVRFHPRGGGYRRADRWAAIARCDGIAGAGSGRCRYHWYRIGLCCARHGGQLRFEPHAQPQATLPRQ